MGCNFSIIMNYFREIPEERRILHAQKHNMKLENVPTVVFTQLSPAKQTRCEKDGEKIKIRNNFYTHHSNFCLLNKIEITDARYHKVGLGSKMLNVIIKFAEKYNCERIEAYVYPYGEFKFSTLEFYKRNGFIFEKNNYAKKYLNGFEKDIDSDCSKI